VLSFVCSALLSTSNVRLQKAEAAGNSSIKFASLHQATTAATRGKYYGQIVFSSDRQNDNGIKLWTMNPDGSNQIQLTFESERSPNLPSYLPVYDVAPKWSPDGTKIAFHSNQDLDLENPSPGDCSVYIMDYQSRKVQRLVFFDQLRSSTFEPAVIGKVEWSPDGSKFVFPVKEIIVGDPDEATTTNIYSVNIDGSGAAKLTDDVQVTTVNAYPTWSPDGKQIAFGKLTALINEIDVMNADGSNPHAIAKFAPGDYPAWVSWSPDGSRILFVRNGEPCLTSSCFQIYTVKSDGTGLAQVTHTPSSHEDPTWSPDGTKIAYSQYTTGPRYVVYVINADGTDEHEISNHAVGIGDSDVDWQPLLAPPSDPPPSVLGLDSAMYIATYPSPPSVQITVTRGGNLDQTVSCDYAVTSSYNAATVPRGTFTFAPGETSRTIPFSYSYSGIFDVSIYNNWGNATFVSGVKHAPILFIGQRDNPIDNQAYFVRQQYRDFLGREPDASGWDFWVNHMDTCPSGTTYTECQNLKPAIRVDTSAAFFLSIEFQQTGYLVYRTYKAAYGNLPGAPVPIRFSEFLPDTQQIGQGVVVGQSGWEQALETNKQNFMTSFVQRPRFTSAYPTSMTVQQFVDALYTNAGLVPTSAPNRPKAISEFNSTTPADPAARARALRDVAEDPMLTQQEFNRAFVLMQYFGYLRRNPNDTPDSDFSGYNFWLGKLDQFGGNYQAAEMVKAFIVSSEYRQRFGP